MRQFFALVSAVAAVAVAVIGLRHGTYAAGGSDSSCYALMAEAFAAGRLQPSSDLVSQVPWPDAPGTFNPGGFLPSQTRPGAFSPVCAPGFSLLLAPLAAAGGRDALFLFTPIAGALLVWLTFLAARHIAGPLAGVMAAVLVAASPPLLYQVVQPMNDVTTAALWMATFVAVLRRRWALAGVSCGLALLVRPNLLPLAMVVAGAIGVAGSEEQDPAYVPGTRGLPRRSDGVFGAKAGAFALGVLPFGVLVLWFNSALYGSPFRTGYGQLGQLFGLGAVGVNAPRYFSWLVETHTPFPLLAFAAPFVLPREQRGAAGLALALIAATCLVYFVYTPFDDWSYLRFLLPAIALMVVLSCAVLVTLLTFAPAAGRIGLVAAVTIGLALFSVRTAHDRLVFNLKHLEQRYRSAAIVVRDRLPANAVVLSVWDSGAVRFHAGKEALVWEGLDAAWLDRALSWLEDHGRTPFIMLESWEEPAFRSRFSGHSVIGRLDWPPKYEIDRVVRIYDPNDRPRYERGERIETEYVWGRGENHATRRGK